MIDFEKALHPVPTRQPLVLLGQTGATAFKAIIREMAWGRIWTTHRPRPMPGEPWALDNGAFSAWTHGQPFDGARFLKRVRQGEAVGTRPYLAVCPDIVAAGGKSLEFSLGWLPELPPTWPWYLAVQDGMEGPDVEDALPLFAGLFLGGTSAFKRTAKTWADMAHRHGKLFHYARASIPRRLAHAQRVGADSLDTSFPLWTRERMAAFVTFIRDGNPQNELAFVAELDRCPT